MCIRDSHYGIFSGRRWREIVYPHVKAFILAHNDIAPKKAVTKSPAQKTAPAAKKSAPAAKK
jgi:poly(3-hydroxybutyrate) depolymerase